MASIIHTAESDFKPNPNKIDGFRLLTDTLRNNMGINPQYLNFDVRRLMPEQFNAPYHYHRYADELFYIISGIAELRTCEGLSKMYQPEIYYSLKPERVVRINYIITAQNRAHTSIYAHISDTTFVFTRTPKS